MCDTTSKNMTLIEEFEEAFLSCLDSLIIEGTDSTFGDGNRMELEIRIERFLDLSRRMDIFLSQNTIVMSSLNPEEIFNEDVIEVNEELQRKELLQRQHEKITNWQVVLDCLLETATKGNLEDPSCTYDGDIEQALSCQPASSGNYNSEKTKEETLHNGAEYSESPITVLPYNDPKFILVEQEHDTTTPIQENLRLDRHETMSIKYEQHALLMQELQNQLLQLQEMKLEEHRALHKLQQELEQDIDVSENYSRGVVSKESLNDDDWVRWFDEVSLEN